MLIGGEFKWPSASIDIFKNAHGATMYRNRPGGSTVEDPTQHNDTSSSEDDEESCSDEGSGEEDDGFL